MTTHPDTLNLLRETDLGVQMGLYTFDQLLDRIKDDRLKQIVTESRNDHRRLQGELRDLIKGYGSYEEDPSLMTKAMAWMTGNMKMSMDDSDQTAADIITRGCDMGTKTLYKYMNQYDHADLSVRDTARKLIAAEEDLEKQLHPFL